jgi:hypothetical protein
MIVSKTSVDFIPHQTFTFSWPWDFSTHLYRFGFCLIMADVLIHKTKMWKTAPLLHSQTKWPLVAAFLQMFVLLAFCWMKINFSWSFLHIVTINWQ